MKRLIFEIHRWLGILTALFMVLWFVTGLVIVYAPALNQNRLQQRAHGESLSPGQAWLSLGEALQRSTAARQGAFKEERREGDAGKSAERGSQGAVLTDIRLLRHGGLPVWLVEEANGRRYALSALDGSLHQTDSTEARVIAAAWAALPVENVEYLGSADNLALLRNAENFRPIHRIGLRTEPGRQLLISGRTGEVLQDTRTLDRALYWAGNWLHVFRPLELLGLGTARHDVLAWVSGFALVATLAGLIVGWWRWRPGWFGRPTYSEGRTQPYRAFWFRWHFWTGLVGGSAALLWVLSGFLNNNPGQVFSPGGIAREDTRRYLGSSLPPALLQWEARSLPAHLEADIVELSWHRLGTAASLIAHHRDGHRQGLPTPLPALGETSVTEAIGRLTGDTGGAPSIRQTLLTDYDAYYYPRHGRGNAERPLPVIRAELGDSAGTQVYVDPVDGRLLLKTDSSRRVFRWLFSALHHWDFGWLYQRPLWDAWMVVWCLFGLAISVTATVVGWRRLARTLGGILPGRGQTVSAQGTPPPVSRPEEPPASPPALAPEAPAA